MLQEQPNVRETGKYTKDFGHQLEEMFVDFLLEVPYTKKVTLASIFDDQRNPQGHFDVVIELTNGEKIAVQLTATEDKEKMQKRLEDIIIKPFITKLHNDKGEVVLEEEMPRILVGINKKKWGEIFDKVQKEKIDRFVKGFSPAGKEVATKKITQRMLASLEVLCKHRQDKRDLFENKIALFKTFLETIH